MSRLSMGFVLGLNATVFERVLQQAGSTAQDFMLAQDRNTKNAILQTQRATNVAKNAFKQTAAAGVAMWYSFKRAAAGVSSLAQSSVDYQYQTKALASMLGKQEQAGRDMYIAFRKANPSIKEFAPSSVIGRMRELAMAGYSMNEIMESTGAILDTVTASMGTLSEDAATSLAVNLHRGFGNATTSMRDLLDVATKAANLFPMTIGDIANAMGYATEAAVTYNQSLDDTLITIGMLIPVVKTASKAGTAYRNTLMSLTKGPTIAFLEKYGIAVKDGNGQMRQALDIYVDIKRVIDELGKKDTTKSKLEKERLMKMVGGQRGSGMFAALDRSVDIARGAEGTAFEGMQFKDDKAAIMAYRMGVASASGETKRLATEMRDTSKILRDNFAVSLNHAAITAGEFLRPVVDEWTSFLTNMMDGISGVLGGGVVGPGGTGEPAWGGAVGKFIAGATLTLSAAAGAFSLLSAGGMLLRLMAWIKNPAAMLAQLNGASAVMGSGSILKNLLSGLSGTTALITGLGVAVAYAANAVYDYVEGLKEEGREKIRKGMSEEEKTLEGALEYTMKQLNLKAGEKMPLEDLLKLRASGPDAGRAVSRLNMELANGVSLPDAIRKLRDESLEGMSSFQQLSPEEKEKKRAEYRTKTEQVVGQTEEFWFPWMGKKGNLEKLGVNTGELWMQLAGDLMGSKNGFLSQPRQVSDASPSNQAWVDYTTKRDEYSKWKDFTGVEAKFWGDKEGIMPQQAAERQSAYLGGNLSAVRLLDVMGFDWKTFGQKAGLKSVGLFGEGMSEFYKSREFQMAMDNANRAAFWARERSQIINWLPGTGDYTDSGSVAPPFYSPSGINLPPGREAYGENGAVALELQRRMVIILDRLEPSVASLAVGVAAGKLD